MSINQIVNSKRIRKLNQNSFSSGPVVYWMQREQRTIDNWALIYAQQLAISVNEPLIIIVCLPDSPSCVTLRQYSFKMKGLQSVEAKLKTKSIPFIIRRGNPVKEINKFLSEIKVGAIVSDFNPLNIVKQWKSEITANIKAPFYEVDAHNIVPCWHASPKLEYGAYTIRPKINKQLYNFLDAFPVLLSHEYNKNMSFEQIDWVSLFKSDHVNREVSEIEWLKPGEDEALKVLHLFLKTKLDKYNSERNDPNKDVLSNMSPYLHFGQISAQRIYFEIKNSAANYDSKDAYLEELIIRRELSDNLCFYNDNYESLSCLPNWAKTTLDEHKRDIRVYLYSFEQLELAQTHDDLWNAAQKQMVKTGKMHSYMRMYWAKKILEWTDTPEHALKYAINLNDKYQLDGCDPNGYVGILWSIGGLHDRAWKERPIFGKIRYMSYNGCKNKFKIKQYIDKYI